MLGRSRRERIKADAASASELALQLAQDKKFRKRLLSAIRHSSEAGRRARRGLGVSGAVTRLAADRTLLGELKGARSDLQRAYERLEKKRRSHKLRNALILGFLTALGLPRLRSRVMAALRITMTPGERASASDSRNLEELTKEELYELAREADVPGRSEMSKEELVKALRAQS